MIRRLWIWWHRRRGVAIDRDEAPRAMRIRLQRTHRALGWGWP